MGVSYLRRNGLLLPRRGGFDADDRAHKENLRHIESWANSPKDAAELIHFDDFPLASRFPAGAIVVVRERHYQRNFRKPEWEPLVPDPNTYRLHATWSKSALVVTGIRPHRWPAPSGGSVLALLATVDTPPSATVVELDLLVDGVSILGANTLTIAIGARQGRLEQLNIPFSRNQEFQVEVISGGGAENLVVDMYYAPSLDALGVLEPDGKQVERIEVTGPQGDPGSDGVGVPAGGAIDQLLAKASATNYDTKWINAPSGGGTGDVLDMKFKRKTSDTAATSDTTLDNDPHLSWAIGANEVWIFDLVLKFGGPTAADIKMCFGAPAGASGFWGPGVLRYTVSSTVAPAYMRGLGDAEWDSFGLDSAPMQGMAVKAICVNGANAGNFVLRWCQNVSNGTPTTIYTNSHGLGIRVA